MRASLVEETAQKLHCSEQEVFMKAAESCVAEVNPIDAWFIYHSEGYLMTWTEFFCQQVLGLQQTADITKYKNRKSKPKKGGLA